MSAGLRRPSEGSEAVLASAHSLGAGILSDISSRSISYGVLTDASATAEPSGNDVYCDQMSHAEMPMPSRPLNLLDDELMTLRCPQALRPVGWLLLLSPAAESTSAPQSLDLAHMMLVEHLQLITAGLHVSLAAVDWTSRHA